MPLPEHLARATVGASRGRTVPQALRGGTFLNREHIRHKNQKNGTLSSPVPCMSILEATPTISKPWQCRLVHRNNADIATPGDPGCTAGSHGAINSWSVTSPCAHEFELHLHLRLASLEGACRKYLVKLHLHVSLASLEGACQKYFNTKLLNPSQCCCPTQQHPFHL